MIIRRLLFCYFIFFTVECCKGKTLVFFSTQGEKNIAIDSTDRNSAERHLLLSETSIRKARNALIASILTLGLFYILALYWLFVAIYHCIKAYNFYGKTNEYDEEFKQARNLLAKTTALAIIHLFLIVGIIVLSSGIVNVLQAAVLANPKNAAIFAILMLFVCDLLFFKVIFNNKNSVKT